MPENQQVVFLSDGGEDVRRVQAYFHPHREHRMDWFPIPMRWTVWPPPTQGLPEERLQTGTAASKPVGSLQHWLWHGKVEDSLERLTNRILDWDLIRKHSAAAEKLSAGLTEFETYMGNHRESTSNDGKERPSAPRSWNRPSTE